VSVLGGSPHSFLLATNITVGDHVTEKVGPFTLNMDTVWATGAAVIVCCVIGIMLRRQITSGVPKRLQAAWEMGIGALTKQVEGTIGPRGASVIPLAATLFLFIFVCNTFTALGLGAHFDWLAPPNADINLPLAMALFVIVLVHISSVRARGIGGYLKHYAMQPFPIYLVLFNIFINLVEEIAKPITLALRLFGNLLSGTLMLSLIAYLGVWKIGAIPVGNVLVLFLNPAWKLFDLGIGAIQAFIFALLTILYFDVAMSTDHDEGQSHERIHGMDVSEEIPSITLATQDH
jgi:F-type H+-transporting ATPase subunit a